MGEREMEEKEEEKGVRSDDAGGCIVNSPLSLFWSSPCKVEVVELESSFSSCSSSFFSSFFFFSSLETVERVEDNTKWVTDLILLARGSLRDLGTACVREEKPDCIFCGSN